jgi:hypothetical protein
MTATILRFPARMRVIAYDQLEADIAAAVRSLPEGRGGSRAYVDALKRELYRELYPEFECLDRGAELPCDSEWPA